jgi:hypothetical protein
MANKIKKENNKWRWYRTLRQAQQRRGWSMIFFIQQVDHDSKSFCVALLKV